MIRIHPFPGLLTLLMALIVPTARAQPYVDIANLKLQHFPGRYYFGSAPSLLSTLEFRADLLLPLERKNGDVILFGATYDALQFTYGQTPEENYHLYSGLLTPGYEKKWDSRWKTMFMVLPGFRSDLKEGTTDDFQLGGAALATLKVSDSLQFRFGMYYNREFFGNYFMALAGIDWKVSRRLHIFGLLPSSLNLEYRFGGRVYGGFSFQSDVASYRLENGNYVREGDKFWGYDSFRLYVNLYLTKHLVWYAEGGVTAGRLYKIYTPQDEPVETHPVYARNLDGAVVNTGLAYRFRLDERE